MVLSLIYKCNPNRIIPNNMSTKMYLYIHRLTYFLNFSTKDFLQPALKSLLPYVRILLYRFMGYD